MLGCKRFINEFRPDSSDVLFQTLNFLYRKRRWRMKKLKMVTLLLLKREGFLQRLRLKKCTLDVFCCHLVSSFFVS